MKNIEKIKSIIAEQNPWWKSSFVPKHLAPSTERPLAKYLWERILKSRLKRYLIVLGPRRVGKTTVMYQTVRHLLNNKIAPEKIQWVRLDHPLLVSLDLGFIVKTAIELSKATKAQPLYLFLDELVYAEQWDLWLKTFYDEHWPVVIVASASASVVLHKEKESGVGRWEEFHLSSYRLTELLQLYDNKNIKALSPIKKQGLHSTIEILSNELPHTQFDFEKERKLLMSYGGFPEILIRKKEDDKMFEIEKKLVEDIEDFKKIIRSKKNKNKQNTFEKALSKKENKNFQKKSNKTLDPSKDTIQYSENNSNTIDHDTEQKTSYIFDKSSHELAFFQRTQQILRADAIEKAVYKDIPQAYRIDSPIALEKLLYILATQITDLLSFKNISQDIQEVSPQTLERYMNYLIQTYLIFTLSNYDNNERDIQRRQKKVYFVDVAIRNAALLKERDQIFNDPVELGKLYENLVATHLYHLGKQPHVGLYHWKRGKHEVDFIYDDINQPMAFEIGSSKKHSTKGLTQFLKENPKFQNACYYVAPDLPFLSPEKSLSGIGKLPLDLLLLATGLQQEKALSHFLGKL